MHILNSCVHLLQYCNDAVGRCTTELMNEWFGFANLQNTKLPRTKNTHSIRFNQGCFVSVESKRCMSLNPITANDYFYVNV